MPITRIVDESTPPFGPLREIWSNLIDMLQAVEDRLKEMKTVTDELRTDHATLITLTDELIDDHATFILLTDELLDDHDANNTVYAAHTHDCPGSDNGAASRCSKPDTGAEGGSMSASAASALAANLTAGKVSTLSASKVSTITAPAIDAEPDLSAYLTKT